MNGQHETKLATADEVGPIYVSTACLTPAQPLPVRLDAYEAQGLRQIEIGAGVRVERGNLSDLKTRALEFLVHNYFPPPKDEFVLNLASADDQIVRRSLDLVHEAMRLCVELGAPMYTVHAGFVTDPDGFDGTSFTFPDSTDEEAHRRALGRFADVIAQLARAAQDLGLRLLVENNVCPPHLAGKLLLQTPDEFDELFDRVLEPNLGILLDTGHLNVSATTLGFDRVEFVETHRDRIGAVHLHDNDGCADQHRPAGSGSWVFDALDLIPITSQTPVVVEAKFPDVTALARYVHQLSSWIRPERCAPLGQHVMTTNASMPTRSVPVANPNLGSAERNNLLKAFDSGWISSQGEFIERFEVAFAELVDSRYAESTSNGTTALHLALEALDLGPGAEVIVPALTYVATVNAVVYARASPVFVDVDPGTLNPTPELIAEAITDRTEAVILAHLYGNPAPLEEIVSLCRKRGLYLIEDAAEALGASYNGRPAGSWGHVGTFSFYANKTLTTGEGGMVVSNREQLIARVAKLKNQGQSATRRYWHDVIGYNYRMTNLQAAIGLAQVERMTQIMARKRKIARTYRTAIRHPGVRFQAIEPGGEHGEWMTPVLLEEPLGSRCAAIREQLTARGVENRPIFVPIPLLEPYGGDASRYPVATRIGSAGFCLPAGPKLEDEDLEYVCEQVNETLRKFD